MARKVANKIGNERMRFSCQGVGEIKNYSKKANSSSNGRETLSSGIGEVITFSNEMKRCSRHFFTNKIFMLGMRGGKR